VLAHNTYHTKGKIRLFGWLLLPVKKRIIRRGPKNYITKRSTCAMEDDGITGHDAQVVNVILRSSRSMRQKRRAIMFYLARAGRRVENHRRG
jgi:hypothetical protein